MKTVVVMNMTFQTPDGPVTITEVRADLYDAANRLEDAKFDITVNKLTAYDYREYPVLGGPLQTIAQMECELIEKALEHFNGNKTRAAESLGVTIKTLYNKLHEYGLFDKYKVNGRGRRPLGMHPALGAPYNVK